jgi:hypothetical protein
MGLTALLPLQRKECCGFLLPLAGLYGCLSLSVVLSWINTPPKELYSAKKQGSETSRRGYRFSKNCRSKPSHMNANIPYILLFCSSTGHVESDRVPRECAPANTNSLSLVDRTRNVRSNVFQQ